MKYLKKFEDNSNVTLREKIESIVRAYEYMNSHKKADMHHTAAFIASVFGLLDCRFDKELKKYIFPIDRIISNLVNPVWQRRNKDSLDKIEGLYTFSKFIDQGATCEYVEKVLDPLFKLQLFGGDASEYHNIYLFYADFYRVPRFSIHFRFHQDLFEMDEDRIKQFRGHLGDDWKKSDNLDEYEKDMIGRLRKDFYKYRQIFKYELENLDLESKGFYVETSDSSSFNSYYEICLLLTTKENFHLK